MPEREKLIVKMLGDIFYDVVPQERATYCVKDSAICVRVLKHFGVHAEIQNCQLWCLTNDQNYAIGFLGKPPTEGKWDGHAICRTKSFFVDCASFHLKTQFNIEVPLVIVGRIFQIPSQIIARCDLPNDSHLLWLYPPPRAPKRQPIHPLIRIKYFADEIIRRMEQKMRSDAVQ